MNSKGELKTNETAGIRQAGGSDTTMHLDFRTGERTDELGRIMSEEELVAHELWHAWSYNYLYGPYLDEINPLTGITRDEEWAVRFQNLVASTDGGRTCYGKKDLSGVATVQFPKYFLKK